jgi:uncharacterized membrane protein
MEIKEADLLALFVLVIFGMIFGICGIVVAFMLEAGLFQPGTYVGILAIVSVMLSVICAWWVMIIIARIYWKPDQE